MSEKPYLSMGDAIRAFLDKHGIRDDASVQAIVNDWDKMMGKPVAQNTEKIWFNKGTLYVKMRSPLWKNELHLARSKIRQMINERARRELVTEVKIV